MAGRRGDETPGAAWDAALARPADLLGGTSANGGFAARLDRWAADARIDEAALQRARERWLREVAEQEATLAGVLADLAERRTSVVVRTSRARRHHGVIVVVGADFVGLRPQDGPEVLVAVDAVTSIHTAPAVAAAAGDRTVTTGLRLADVLRELAVDRERVQLVPRSGDDAVSGSLRSVGVDVAVVRTDADPPATAYLPLAVVGEVRIG